MEAFKTEPHTDGGKITGQLDANGETRTERGIMQTCVCERENKKISFYYRPEFKWAAAEFSCN